MTKQSYSWKCPEELEEYVKPTYFADSNSKEIQDSLAEILNGVKTPKEAAIKIYYFVRDEIKFATGDVGLKASQTLKIKKGPSLLKGSLAIAMFRGAGIPARYRLIDADEKKVKGIVDNVSYFLFPLYRKLAPDHIILHIIPQVYLNDQWLNADPLFDKGFFDGLKNKNVEVLGNVKSIDWDGTTNISPQEYFVKKEIGTFANADRFIINATKRIRYLYYIGTFYLFNRYIVKIRNMVK